MTIDEANENENVKGIFTIEQIGQRASSKYAAGQIIEQSPERGKTVKGNRVISVFVSSGAKTEENAESRQQGVPRRNAPAHQP